jgi:hypothetical protein
MAFPVATTPWAGSNPNPAYSGTFIPEIWSGKLVEKFYDATVLGAIANTDYEGEIKNQGDTVNIRQRPDVTINDYTANVDLAIERPAEAIIQLLIDQGKYFNVALDDVMEVQADIDQLSIWAEDAAEQMKISVDTDVLDFLTNVGATGNGYDDIAAVTTINPVPNVGTTAGRISGDINLGINDVVGNSILVDNGGTNTSPIEYILRAGQVLDEQNIPESGRWMVIPAWFAALIKNSDLRDASLAGDSTSILRNGRLGMVDRFTLYLSNLLTDGETAGSFPILFGTNSGLTFAAQFTKMETIRSERSFSNLLRGLQVYGRKVVVPKALGVGFVRKT